MDFNTINDLTQKELLCLIFGFFLGVSTRVGGYIFTLITNPIKNYFKQRKRKKKKTIKKAKKQAYLEWKMQNDVSKLSDEEIYKLLYQKEYNKRL